MFEIQEESSLDPIIKIIGIGGAGCTAINYIIEQGLKGVEYIFIDSDKQSLSQSQASVLLKTDIEFPDYLASTLDQQVNINARESLQERIKSQILNADLIFIIAGMGGTTETKHSTTVAQIANELNILTVAVITPPFTHDEDRTRCANDGIISLYEYVDSLMIVPNTNTIDGLINDQIELDLIIAANTYIHTAIKSLVEFITEDGVVGIDFSDVCLLLSKSGLTKFSVATASGSNRAKIATEKATALLQPENTELLSLKGLLVNMKHDGDNFTMREYKEVMNGVRSKFNNDETIVIIRTSSNNANAGELRVTIFATGCTNKT